MVSGAAPTLRLERALWNSGETVVVGIDEVGRGSWAGPVTVGAVVAPNKNLSGIRDSKLLSRSERVVAAQRIRDWVLAIGVGHASHEECDALGLSAAQRLAAQRALEQVEAQGYVAEHIVLDGKHNYLGGRTRCTTVVKGDMTILSVAAASVVAKVERDALMAEESEHFPHYQFQSNSGYPAPAHRSALCASGPSAIHRRRWAYLDDLAWPHMKYEREPRLF